MVIVQCLDNRHLSMSLSNYCHIINPKKYLISIGHVWLFIPIARDEATDP